MLYSMTGFGKGEVQGKNKKYMVEMKSVNHRFCEIFVRTPRDFGFIDEKIKVLVREKISRGKINVIVRQDDINDINEGSELLMIEINRSLAKKYVQEIRDLSKELKLKNDLSISNVTELPEIIRIEEKEEDSEEIFKVLMIAVYEAIEKLIEFRKIEGQKLEKDFINKIIQMRTSLDEIKRFAPLIPISYMKQLNKRISEYLDIKDIDEERIAQEVAIYADKCCIDEEIIRLESHLEHFEEELKKGDRVGRKLDFITQEINRELNTIGSKANDSDMTRSVVEMKSILEQMREQVQNIE